MIKKHRALILYLAVLTIFTLAAGWGYGFVRHDMLMSFLFLGLCYMPTPFLALIATNCLLHRPQKLIDYGSVKKINKSGITTTIRIFTTWAIIFLAFTALLSIYSPSYFGTFITTQDQLIANLTALAGTPPTNTAGMPPPLLLLPIAFVSAIFAGFSINGLVALGEEYGWRGFLRKELPGSFFKKYTFIGLLWGIWHAPIILQGYNFGADRAIPGSLLFILVTIMLGYLIGIVVERHDNVLYAAAFHGMFNGFAGVFAVMLTAHDSLITGPIGIVAIAAMGCTLYLYRSLLPKSQPAS